MSQARKAEHIVWDAPGGVQMTLIPEANGALEVETSGGVILVRGRQCRHLQGIDAKKTSSVESQLLAEIDLTIVTPCCQVTWKANSA